MWLSSRVLGAVDEFLLGNCDFLFIVLVLTLRRVYLELELRCMVRHTDYVYLCRCLLVVIDRQVLRIVSDVELYSRCRLLQHDLLVGHRLHDRTWSAHIALLNGRLVPASHFVSRLTASLALFARPVLGR